MTRGVLAAALIGAGVLVAATGCSADSTGPQPSGSAAAGRPVIVANFYPTQWLATELAGDAADVISLTPEGTEPHDLAVNADGQRALGRANVVLYLGASFQPDVQRAVGELGPAVAAVDLLTAPGVKLRSAGNLGGEHALADNRDPHVWLSPIEMSAMADAAAAAITRGAPQLSDHVKTSLAHVHTELQSLDTRYRRALTGCASTVLVTSHAAFGYLADEYGLEQVPIAGIAPEDEPDPKTLKSIAEVAKRRNVQTVFFEDALPPDLSKTVADDIGAQVSLLSALEFDPRGSLGADQNYLTVMTGNLDRLAKGLQCRGS